MAEGLGLAGGYGAAGAAEGLEQVLRRMHFEMQMRQRAAEAQQQFGLQERGQNIAMRGQDQVHNRWSTEREDAQAAAAKAEEAAAAQKAAQGAYLQQNPHLAQLTGARSLFGLTTNDPHAVEAPDVHGAHEAAERQTALDDFTAREGVKTTGQLRVVGAQGANQMNLARFRLANQPQSQPATSAYSNERATRIGEAVDNLVTRVSNKTAGYGSWLAALPATDAKDFAADLKKLAANIAFSELTEMREASKTGGALGQVSNVELGLLQSALGALDQDQSPENLIKNLHDVKAISERWQQAKARTAQGGTAPTQSTVTPQDNDPLGLFK